MWGWSAISTMRMRTTHLGNSVEPPLVARPPRLVRTTAQRRAHAALARGTLGLGLGDVHERVGVAWPVDVGVVERVQHQLVERRDGREGRQRRRRRNRGTGSRVVHKRDVGRGTGDLGVSME